MNEIIKAMMRKWFNEPVSEENTLKMLGEAFKAGTDEAFKQAMAASLEIPAFKESDRANDAGHGNPLTEFICDFEPAQKDEEERFRAKLQKVVDYARKSGELHAKFTGELAGIDLKMPGEPDYAEIEREHLGDAEKKTGIYATPVDTANLEEPEPAHIRPVLMADGSYGAMDMSLVRDDCDHLRSEPLPLIYTSEADDYEEGDAPFKPTPLHLLQPDNDGPSYGDGPWSPGFEERCGKVVPAHRDYLVRELRHAAMTVERNEASIANLSLLIGLAAQYLEKLPADWFVDSSLERWFPETAKKYQELLHACDVLRQPGGARAEQTRMQFSDAFKHTASVPYKSQTAGNWRLVGFVVPNDGPHSLMPLDAIEKCIAPRIAAAVADITAKLDAEQRAHIATGHALMERVETAVREERERLQDEQAVAVLRERAAVVSFLEQNGRYANARDIANGEHRTDRPAPKVPAPNDNPLNATPDERSAAFEALRHFALGGGVIFSRRQAGILVVDFGIPPGQKYSPVTQAAVDAKREACARIAQHWASLDAPQIAKAIRTSV